MGGAQREGEKMSGRFPLSAKLNTGSISRPELKPRTGHSTDSAIQAPQLEHFIFLNITLNQPLSEGSIKTRRVVSPLAEGWYQNGVKTVKLEKQISVNMLFLPMFEKQNKWHEIFLSVKEEHRF